MKKGKVFISSTIYDFADLRSAIKYYLTQFGYEVYMSEKSDFPRDASENSYDTCLSTIEKCDYFILLIGNRVGGLLKDGDRHISITRKEYRKAYELFKQGKIEKVINFIRSNVWIAKEERKSISKKDENNQSILTTPSNILEEPVHIFSFIDEVRRIKEMKKYDYGETLPRGNWVNLFNDFSDIINTLNIELNLKSNVSELIWIKNIEEEMKRNLKLLYVKKSTAYCGFHQVVTELRNKCVEQLRENNHQSVKLTAREYKHICAAFPQMPVLEYYTLKNAVLEGVFLKFNAKESNIKVDTLYKWIITLLGEIEYIDKNRDFYQKGIEYYVKQNIRNRKDGDKIIIEYYHIIWFIIFHDKLDNIIKIYAYLIKCFANDKNKIIQPVIYPLKVIDNFGSTIDPIIKEYYNKTYGTPVNDTDIDSIFREFQTGGL